MAFAVGHAPDSSEGEHDYRPASVTERDPYLGVVHSYLGPIKAFAKGASPEDPDWSPDGTKILFISGGEITVLVLKTRKTYFLHDGRHARWSPNGRRIVYVFNSGIWVMDANGLHPKRLIR
jgi:dipeptidyl aminopeptidase/acylaminoacyl peptidase